MTDIILTNSVGEGYLAKHGHEGALADSYNKSDGVILFKTNGIFYALPDTNENELNLKSFGFRQDPSIAVPNLNDEEVWAHSLKNSSYSKWKEMSQGN